ncbi:MAG TPA: nitroreductase family deazaflavin-dependent oxidoreductase [Verrucomicrobiae bacterium]|jgi:deazaflavin-dependent oxidoreductase (nitroreductase family)|nr:nitroreductase family deazaflavin-dependent oxidoreductase [Verrucomicrobiae bacterium]
MEDELVGSGRFARLGIRGRRSGESRSVNVGFVEEPDGSLLVAAGSPDAAWARNLLAEPDCTVTIGERMFLASAEPLDDDDPRRGRAVRELILRYGTPSEGLGSGLVFVIRPLR